jgi:hypothetical protein
MFVNCQAKARRVLKFGDSLLPANPNLLENNKKKVIMFPCEINCIDLRKSLLTAFR